MRQTWRADEIDHDPPVKVHTDRPIKFGSVVLITALATMAATLWIEDAIDSAYFAKAMASSELDSWR